MDRLINILIVVLLQPSFFSASSMAGQLTEAQKIAQSFILPLQAPEPQENKISKAKVDLGRRLFLDPRLSVDGTISCNSCHNVMASGSDNRPVSIGVKGQRGNRSAPTVFNSAFLSVQFWDGRANSLEEQAKGPLVNPAEMGMPNHNAVVDRLKKTPGYPELFARAFTESQPITIDNVAKAIASFERTLITPNSAFDRWAKGDRVAISDASIRGFRRMNEIGCVSCHSGPAFAGPSLPSGTGFFQKFPVFTENKYVGQYNLDSDLGRQTVTGKIQDKNFFRVPSLRNVAITAPYFHNGRVTQLKEAIRVMGKTQLNQDLVSRDVDDIYAFLLTLTGEIPQQILPRLSMTPGTTLTPE